MVGTFLRHSVVLFCFWFPCGRLSWLLVDFSAQAKYSVSYCIVCLKEFGYLQNKGNYLCNLVPNSELIRFFCFFAMACPPSQMLSPYLDSMKLAYHNELPYLFCLQHIGRNIERRACCLIQPRLLCYRQLSNVYVAFSLA